MKVILFSRYGDLGASSRLRHLQYLPLLEREGIEIDVSPLFSNEYVQALYDRRTRGWKVLRALITRALVLTRIYKYDVVIIEKELFPFFPSFAERMLAAFGVAYIVDYDDALFHRYDCHHNKLVRTILGEKIDKVMKYASLVVAGNLYLASRAGSAGAREVDIIPTVVNLERYQVKSPHSGSCLVIGWIGTPETSRYLLPLLEVFERLKKEFQLRFVAVGARSVDFCNSPIEAVPWAEESEVDLIRMFDIGIMPLNNSPWERGKCGYKLIQYFACGVPVVASPVGVNCDIVEDGLNGRLADSIEEWERVLREMITSGHEALHIMGANGRRKVEMEYSLKSTAPKLVSAIQRAAEKKSTR